MCNQEDESNFNTYIWENNDDKRIENKNENKKKMKWRSRTERLNQQTDQNDQPNN